ncbi:MAG: type VI secretion system baseplate subunit TssE [Nitrospira sp.]
MFTLSVLDRLLDDDPRAGDPYLDSLDVKDPAKLALRLRSPQDSATRFLGDSLQPEERELVDREGAGSNELLLALTEGLNRIIGGPPLYERKRFEGVKLSPDTVRLMEDSRKTSHMAVLNRLLLDEIFPDELHKMREPAPSSASIRELKRSLSRDIEVLLNTRRELLEGAPPECKEINRSLLMFGLPDFTSYSLLNREHRMLIRRSVEEALGKFEPRLKSVQVTLEPPRPFDAALHFRIDALLRLDPAPEPVRFDAALQLGTSSYTVRGEA